MAKIIVNCRYMKGGGKVAVNLVEYMGTRPGVELNEQDAHRLNPSTDKQKELIKQLEQLIPDFKNYFEYEDYRANPTVENASALITAAMEYNLDIFATKENLVEYMGKRPGAVREGEHGLFNGEDQVDIRAAMDEVANHNGIIWTTVVSLRRDDAERLGYNNQKSWKDLICIQARNMEENLKMPYDTLKWYASFHNESHHPHAHIVMFCADPAQDGYLTKKGIEKIKSGFAHEIFNLDFLQIYEQKQLFNDDLTLYSRERMQALIDEINIDRGSHPELERMLTDLASDLQNHKGKKVYGFLKPEIKAKVDAIVRALAADPRIAELYKGWCECQNEIIKTYKFDVDDPSPLEKQPAFRSIHNVVIKAAEKLNTEQNAQTFVTVPLRVGDFLFQEESEEKPHAPQEQERAEDTDIHTASQAQAPPQPQARPQEERTSIFTAPEFDRSALTGPAAMAVTRLIRSLGNNVYNSYQNGHNRLFAGADRRQLQKEQQKKTAQGHQRDDHEQKQTQY